MFERILLAVDGSEPAKKGVPLAGGLALKFGAEVIVLHVREHEVNWGADIDLESPAEAADLVDDVVRELKDRGVSARGEIIRAVMGLAAKEIVREAAESDAGVIVMGTRGLTDWKGLLLGSVAHKVLSHAPCPVLLAR